MRTDGSDNAENSSGRDPQFEEIFEAAHALQQRLAILRPNLVANVVFGPLAQAPESERDVERGSFNDFVENEGRRFRDHFAKSGDGFCDVDITDPRPHGPTE